MKKSKGRSRPTPDVGADTNNIAKVASKLGEALIKDNYNYCLENYYDRGPEEVSLMSRDGAVQVLRCLKVLFHMPQSVFFTAVYYLDEFLIRMKVKEKYLSCLTISCLNVAAIKHGHNINTSQLVMLSQRKCTVKDMERMSLIIKEKLDNNENANSSKCTAFDLLTVYLDIFKCIANQFKTKALLRRMLKFNQLSNRLEVLISDSSCLAFRPSLVALALIQSEFENSMEKERIPHRSNCYSMEMFYLLAVMIELQHLCKMTVEEYTSCLKIVRTILQDYDEEKHCPQPQNLIWRICSRRSFLSPRFISSLDSIQEY